MSDYTRVYKPFDFRGVQLTREPDLLDEGKFVQARNVRRRKDGTLSIRSGIGLRADVDSGSANPILFIRRLTNYITGAYTYFVSDGSKLYYESNHLPVAYTEIDSGYGAKPLTSAIMRPPNSPAPLMYFSTSSRSRKSDVGGNDSLWGIVAPTIAPTAQITRTNFKALADFINGDEETWAGDGVIATGATSGSRFSTTIARVKYDGATPGWACVIPTTVVNIQPGIFITIDRGTAEEETVLVEEIKRAVTNTTIGAIKFDSGSTGACTIQLSAPTADLGRDSALLINSGGGTEELTRVLSVTYGKDGVPSLRCVTTNTHAAAETITGLDNLRLYLANAHVATDTLESDALATSVVAGTGYIQKTADYDLSTINSRPTTLDDEIVLFVKVDDASRLSEIKVMFEVSAAAIDFARDFYYKAFNQADLQPVLSNTITQLAGEQRILQRTDIRGGNEPIVISNPILRSRVFNIDSGGTQTPNLDSDINILGGGGLGEPITPDGTLIPGSQTYGMLRFRLRDLIRVGGDNTRSLKNVRAIRIQITATNTISFSFDSMYLMGTYGLEGGRVDSGDLGAPYEYCYVYRNSSTGDESNPSPPMRSGISLRRQSAALAATTSADAQVDFVDFYRRGGSLNLWAYVGSAANASPSFTDNQPDVIVENGRPLSERNFRPFPVLDLVRTGTCNVVGTTITRASGDTFNLLWPRGTFIRINGITTSLYSNPSSTTQLEIEHNLGSLSGASFEVLDAVLDGTPLPCIIGQYSPANPGVGPTIFACGSIYEPGIVYYTNFGNPAGSDYSNKIEITSPSEPLMNLVIYDGRVYAYSTDYYYLIEDRIGGLATADFAFSMVANSIGLFARYAICVGPEGIYFRGKDGIYLSQGGQPTCVSNDIATIFPREGVKGASSDYFIAPDDTLPDKQFLSVKQGFLYYDYLGINNQWQTLVLDTITGAWSVDGYTPKISRHYADEGDSLSTILGSSDGKIYTLGGSLGTNTSDEGVDISFVVETRYESFNDPRALKDAGDSLLEYKYNESDLNVFPIYDNRTIVSTLYLPPASSTRTRSIVPMTGSRLNIGLFITANASSLLELYAYELNAIVQPENTILRPSDWTDAGYPGAKFVQGVWITADTYREDKLIQVQYDGEQVALTLTINHDGYLRKFYPLDGVQSGSDSDVWVPFIAHLLRLAPSNADNTPWQFYPDETQFIFRPEPENCTYYETQPSSFGLNGYFSFDQHAYLTLKSISDVILSIFIDSRAVKAYTIATTSGVYSKVRVPLDPDLKGKLVRFTLASSESFRLQTEGCEVRLKLWGSAEDFLTLKPFGGPISGPTPTGAVV